MTAGLRWAPDTWPGLAASTASARPALAFPTVVGGEASAAGGQERLAPQEGQQVGVDLVLEGGGEAVWRARVVDFLRSGDEPGRFAG